MSNQQRKHKNTKTLKHRPGGKILEKIRLAKKTASGWPDSTAGGSTSAHFGIFVIPGFHGGAKHAAFRRACFSGLYLPIDAVGKKNYNKPRPFGRSESVDLCG